MSKTMSNEMKIRIIKGLIGKKETERAYYALLRQLGDLKANYGDYLITEPINCDEELKRVPEADYELCTALLTMLLREDHFCNGSLVRRCESGAVDSVLKRMIQELEK